MLLLLSSFLMVTTWRGALEVGKVSTVASHGRQFDYTFNYILTQRHHDRDNKPRKSFGDSKILRDFDAFELENQSNHWTEWSL
jgi:hypothetical protein